MLLGIVLGMVRDRWLPPAAPYRRLPRVADRDGGRQRHVLAPAKHVAALQ
jgi:hypothetical protein